MVSDAEGAGRVVGDATALRLLMGVQKYALLFHDFSLAEVRSLVHGRKGQRRLVTRFAKGDVLVRRGEAATFFGLLLEGELGPGHREVRRHRDEMNTFFVKKIMN